MIARLLALILLLGSTALYAQDEIVPLALSRPSKQIPELEFSPEVHMRRDTSSQQEIATLRGKAPAGTELKIQNKEVAVDVSGEFSSEVVFLDRALVKVEARLPGAKAQVESLTLVRAATSEATPTSVRPVELRARFGFTSVQYTQTKTEGFSGRLAGLNVDATYRNIFLRNFDLNGAAEYSGITLSGGSQSSFRVIRLGGAARYRFIEEVWSMALTAGAQFLKMEATDNRFGISQMFGPSAGIEASRLFGSSTRLLAGVRYVMLPSSGSGANREFGVSVGCDWQWLGRTFTAAVERTETSLDLGTRTAQSRRTLIGLGLKL